jgi:short-subunit dehydrogenase
MTTKQQTISVTGASQGIGAAAAYLRLAQDPAQNFPVSRLLWAEITLDARLI